MNIKKLTALALVGLCFCALILYLLAGHRQTGSAGRASETAQAPLRLNGPLSIQAMSDFRVGGRKIVLCGVSFRKPKSMEPLMLDGARRAFQGKAVDCVQVGGGTPCDGKAAARFGDAVVVQCFMQDKSDLALDLSKGGFLCDLPAQSGGIYQGC